MGESENGRDEARFDSVKIVPATIDHLAEITEIYNEAVLSTTATLETEPIKPEARENWFLSHGKNHPIFLALHNQRVTGWASLSPWSPKNGYNRTAELSIYVRKVDRGGGVGTLLIRSILREGERGEVRTVLARIAGENQISVRLHEREGFFTVGIMKEVGEKFGQLVDVQLMQRIFPPPQLRRNNRKDGA